MITMFVRHPKKRKATRERLNVFVSKAVPVETRVILRDPTLSSRTYFVFFQPSQSRGFYFIRDILPSLEYSIEILSRCAQNMKLQNYY